MAKQTFPLRERVAARDHEALLEVVMIFDEEYRSKGWRDDELVQEGLARMWLSMERGNYKGGGKPLHAFWNGILKNIRLEQSGAGRRRHHVSTQEMRNTEREAYHSLQSPDPGPAVEMLKSWAREFKVPQCDDVMPEIIATKVPVHLRRLAMLKFVEKKHTPDLVAILPGDKEFRKFFPDLVVTREWVRATVKNIVRRYIGEAMEAKFIAAFRNTGTIRFNLEGGGAAAAARAEEKNKK